MSKSKNIFLAISVSIFTGCGVGIIISALSAPGLYTNPQYILSVALSTASIWGIVYLSLPVFVLSFCSYIKTERLSLSFCTFVPTLWLLTIFLWWAYKPWKYYGTFPWYGLERHFIGLLPIALSAGWVYWKVLNNQHNLSDATVSRG